MELEGVVTNVTAFGAFVDVGVHQDGLVHVSQLADRFVKDPHEVAKVGQRIQVRVLEVDLGAQANRAVGALVGSLLGCPWFGARLERVTVHGHAQDVSRHPSSKSARFLGARITNTRTARPAFVFGPNRSDPSDRPCAQRRPSGRRASLAHSLPRPGAWTRSSSD